MALAHSGRLLGARFQPAASSRITPFFESQIVSGKSFSVSEAQSQKPAEPSMPTGYTFRIDFNFVNHAGELLRSKTWQLTQQRDDPPRTLLLQLDAKLISRLPHFQEVQKNHITFTLVVEQMTGDPVAKSYHGIANTESLAYEIEAYPLTIGVTLQRSSIDFTLHVGTGNK